MNNPEENGIRFFELENELSDSIGEIRQNACGILNRGVLDHEAISESIARYNSAVDMYKSRFSEFQELCNDDSLVAIPEERCSGVNIRKKITNIYDSAREVDKVISQCEGSLREYWNNPRNE